MTAALSPLAAVRRRVHNSAMTTPADLRAMRVLLGYERHELGQLLGGLSGDDVRKLERSRTWFVREGHAKLLRALVERVNTEIDLALGNSAPAFLITYPNDGAFRDYEPKLSAWLRYNSAHVMMTARLLDEWMLKGDVPEVMELVPTDYERFREARGLPDSAATRIAWAGEYRANIKSREGMPGPSDSKSD